MKRQPGIPASSFFTNRGINAAAERQAMPVVRDSISESFQAARDTVAKLEQGRSEATCPSWSVAQHCAVQP